MKTTAVEIEHLKKSFGSNEVLKDVNLKIEKGETVAVLGKSGSGKSVLIKCLIGLIEPDDGKISLLDKHIISLNDNELNRLRKKIGFLFQNSALYDSMTVRENLAFPLRGNHEISEQEKETLIKTALKNVGLEEAIDKMPAELSGGMKKRVGLARALMLQPEIIFYDEPTTGLDPITAKEISNLIVDIQEKYNTTSIIITHDLKCAHITADRLIILKDGQFIIEGTYEEISKSKDKWISSFFE